MRAEHVNAFLVPSVRVIQRMARTEVAVGRLVRLEESNLDDNLSIIIGVQGRLSGTVVLTARRDVARALASRIAGEPPEGPPAEDIRAIFAEVANTIVGNATGHLYDLGFREGITPPTVVEGPCVSFRFGDGVESVRIPLDTDVGRLEMIVSMTRDGP